MRIDSEFKNLIPPLSEDEFRGLEQSILEEGCRDALVVWNDTLIDGHNRYEICLKHELPFRTVQKEFSNRDEAMLWMIDTQRGRRNLSKADSILLAQKKTKLLAVQAREKISRTTSETNRRRNNPSFIKNDKPEPTIHVQEETAKLAGVSIGTLAQFEQVQKKKPELIDDIRAGELTIGGAYKIVKKEESRKKRQQAIEQKISENPSGGYVDIYTTEKKYRVVYADPPWSYGDKQNIDGLGGAEKHYPTMSIGEICDILVPSADNAVLFLWATSPMLEDAFKVINAWGFKYKSSFVWDKVAHNMGHYNSVRHELLLICTKGSCAPDVPKLFDSVVSIERTEHSRKPKEFRDIIDTLYPIGDRLELFAREAPEGWDVWGNMA